MTAARTGNLLAALPAAQAGESIDELLRAPDLRIERIVSRGQVSPPGFWYEQPQREWVLVIEGAGTVAFEDGSEVTLRRGDWLDIPARCRHRVAWTDPDRLTVWLAVHLG